jgi:hypothetical protein
VWTLGTSRDDGASGLLFFSLKQFERGFFFLTEPDFGGMIFWSVGFIVFLVCVAVDEALVGWCERERVCGGARSLGWEFDCPFSEIIFILLILILSTLQGLQL